jgi:hypothetical protein
VYELMLKDKLPVIASKVLNYQKIRCEEKTASPLIS